MDWNSGNKDQNLKQNQCYLCNNRLPKLLFCHKFYGVLAFTAAFDKLSELTFTSIANTLVRALLYITYKNIHRFIHCKYEP